MKSRQVTALLLSAIMTVSACMPMNGISAFAAENTGAGSTETAAVVEPVSEEQAEEPEEEPAEAQVEEQAVEEESVEEPAKEEADEPAEEETEEVAEEKQAEEASEQEATEADSQSEAQTEEAQEIVPEDQTAQKSEKADDGEHTLTAYVADEDEGTTYVSRNVPEGESVELQVVAYTSGGEEPKYTWYADSTDSDPLDSNGDTCTVEAPAMYESRYYYCVVTDDYSNSVYIEFDLYGVFNDKHENVSFDTAEEIKVGDSKVVSVSSEKPHAYYKFVPDSTAKYEFYANSYGSDTYGVLYDSSENELTYNDDTHNYDFSVVYELTAGETYYFLARYLSEDSLGSFEVHLVEQTLTVDDDETYEGYYAPGEEVTLSVSAQSKNPITYTWTVDDAAVDCNSSSYTFIPDKNCSVKCVISDGSQSVDRFFAVRIQNNLSVIANVEGLEENDYNEINAKVAYGQTAVLKADVKANDVEGVTYQWRDADGYEIEGATSSTYTTDAITEATRFECFVKDRFGNNDYASFYLSIDNNLVAYPVGSEGATSVYLFPEVGTEQVLEVFVSMNDDEGATYEWSKYNQDVDYYETIENTSEDPLKYTISSVGTNEEYKFYVRDKYNNDQEIFFYINSENVENNLYAYTIDEYGDRTSNDYCSIDVDQDKTLSVNVEADITTDGVTYQWYYKRDYYDDESDRVAIDGATASEYVLDHTDSDHFKNGDYICDATDQFGKTSSVRFNVNINNDLNAYATGEDEYDHWLNYAVPYGEGKTLSVEAKAIIADGITCQWFDKNEDPIEGATENTYDVASVTEKQEYYCTVTDRFGNNESVHFELSVENEWVAYPDGAKEGREYINIAAVPEQPLTLKVNYMAKSANADLSKLTFEWYRYVYNGEEEGEVKESLTADENPYEYTIDKVTGRDSYYCLVSDQYNNSYNIEFYVRPDSGMSVTPSATPAGEASGSDYTVYVAKGGSVTLNVNATVKYGNKKFTCYWKDDDWEDAGSGTSITVKNVTSRTRYHCEVRDDYGNEEYIYFYIYVQNNLKVYPEGFKGSDTAYIYAKPGTKVKLHTVVEATEKDGLRYEWCNRTDWEYPDVNRDTLEVDAANVEYSCDVTDKYGNEERILFYVMIDNEFEVYPEGAGKDADGNYLDHVIFDQKVGDKLDLKVNKSAGTGDLSYTWYKWVAYTTSWGENEYDFEELEETTADINVTVSETTTYRCVARDDYGNRQQLYFIINVGWLAAHPDGSTTDRISIVTAKGGTKALKVITEAAAGATLTYKWTIGPLNDSGWWPLEEGKDSTTNVLTVDLDQSYRYQCVVKDNFGNQARVYFYVNIDGMKPSSNVGALELTGDNRYEVHVPIKYGAQKELKAVIDKTAGVTYSWERVYGDYYPMTGETDNTITAKGGEANIYICHVTDSAGNMLDIYYYMDIDNELKVTPVGGDGTSDRVDLYAAEGEKVSLGVNVSALNKNELYYEWRDSKNRWLGENATCNITVSGDGAYSSTVYDAFDNSKTVKFYVWTKGAPIDKAQITVAAATYDGKAKTPAVTVKYGGKTLVKDTDYTVSGYANNTNAGTATVTIKGKGNFTGQVTKQFTIAKAAQPMTASLSAAKIVVGATSKVTVSGVKESAKVTYSSSNTAVATVSAAGVVTAKKVGTAKITATTAATTNYSATSKQVTISVLPGATTKITAVAATNGKGIKLTWARVVGASQYQIYRNNKLIKTTGNTLTYTDAKAKTNGTKYTFKIVAKASTGVSTVSKSTIYYKVNRPAIKKLTNSESKKMTVKWAKNTKATGYEIQYALKKTFKGAKTVKVTKKATVSKTIAKLKKGKTYFVRIRTYKKVGKVTYYSAWSAAKKVKIQK